MNPDATYTISNISLEFDTVMNASLASQIRTEYMKSSILYDRILRARNILLNNSDTSFSVDINSPSKSLKGVLLIFMKERSTTKFSHDTEEFFNPKITKVEVTVEGVPNELYAQNMEYRHQYDEIVEHFAEGWLKEAGAIQKDLQLHNRECRLFIESMGLEIFTKSSLKKSLPRPKNMTKKSLPICNSCKKSLCFIC